MQHDEPHLLLCLSKNTALLQRSPSLAEHQHLTRDSDGDTVITKQLARCRIVCIACSARSVFSVSIAELKVKAEKCHCEDSREKTEH